jgi:glucose-1-phosphate cytidylyltransferase
MPMLCVILAGGLGTRLSEETQDKPKPLVTIGGKPIIWHIMMIYSSQGFNDFLIAGGYKNEMLEPEIKKHLGRNSKINFEVLDTGLKTATGGRIKKCIEHAGISRILATYGDGLGNIKLKNLIDLHEQNKYLATLTAVRPPARFGRVVIQDTSVTHFGEKIQADEGWINGGFFVLENTLSELISSDDMPLEHFPFSHLASIGKLGAYKHEDFWQPMDTLREKKELENLWQTNLAPWKTWK